MEATGGLEAPLVCSLQAASFDVVVINSHQAGYFARTMGCLGKTDTIDARAIAIIAEVIDRHHERERFIQPLPEALAALVTRRRQLVTLVVAEHNWLTQAHPQALKSIKRLLMR